MTKQLTPVLVAVAFFFLMAVMPVTAGVDLQNMTNEERAAYWASQPLVSCELRNIGSHLSSTPCYGECPQVYPVYTIGDTVDLHGDNTATGTTYLFLTGPGLAEDGAQIIKPDPAHWPVISDSPDTFRQVSVKSDHTWDWSWDTSNLVLDDGDYFINAVAYPYSLERGGDTPSGRTEITIKNPPGTATTTATTTTAIPVATATPGPSETTMPGVVTIIASGNQIYNLGDEINFTGTNTAGWKTYLYISGPGLSANGSQIQVADPKNAPVVNDNPGSFKQMDVQGDHTWSWKWGTANTVLDAGTYTVYAVARPYDKGNLEKTPYGTVSIVIRKPPVSATTPPTAPIVTPTPPASPGFGTLITLIGLSAVAFIVMRRH